MDISIHDVKYSSNGKDEWEISDDVINEAYPSFTKAGRGRFWGAKRIPNSGILRGAIAKALLLEKRKAQAEKAELVRQCAEIASEYTSFVQEDKQMFERMNALLTKE